MLTIAVLAGFAVGAITVAIAVEPFARSLIFQRRSEYWRGYQDGRDTASGERS